MFTSPASLNSITLHFVAGHEQCFGCMFASSFSIWRYENMKCWKTRLLQLNICLPLPVDSNFLPSLLTSRAGVIFMACTIFSPHLTGLVDFPKSNSKKNGVVNTVLYQIGLKRCSHRRSQLGRAPIPDPQPKSVPLSPSMLSGPEKLQWMLIQSLKSLLAYKWPALNRNKQHKYSSRSNRGKRCAEAWVSTCLWAYAHVRCMWTSARTNARKRSGLNQCKQTDK